MSTGITLFGGLAVVLGLFGLLRLLRLPPVLAGLIAAALPLFAYTLTLFGNWPGLDVVAIHIAVFVSAAYVLVVFTRYREKHATLHWVPKALIGFFLVLIVMNAGFLYLSTQGLPPQLAGLLLPGSGNHLLHTGFSGTTRHGEEAAKAIGADLSRQHDNAELGWEVRVEGLRAPTVGRNNVVVLAEDGDGRPLSNLAGALVLARPGASGKRVDLQGAAGQYQAELDFPASGLWLLQLELGKYRQSWEIQVP